MISLPPSLTNWVRLREDRPLRRTRHRAHLRRAGHDPLAAQDRGHHPRRAALHRAAPRIARWRSGYRVVGRGPGGGRKENVMKRIDCGSVLIQEACRANGLPEPRWAADENSVTLGRYGICVLCGDDCWRTYWTAASGVATTGRPVARRRSAVWWPQSTRITSAPMAAPTSASWRVSPMK